MFFLIPGRDFLEYAGLVKMKTPDVLYYLYCRVHSVQFNSFASFTRTFSLNPLGAHRRLDQS